MVPRPGSPNVQPGPARRRGEIEHDDHRALAQERPAAGVPPSDRGYENDGRIQAGSGHRPVSDRPAVARHRQTRPIRQRVRVPRRGSESTRRCSRLHPVVSRRLVLQLLPPHSNGRPSWRRFERRGLTGGGGAVVEGRHEQRFHQASYCRRRQFAREHEKDCLPEGDPAHQFVKGVPTYDDLVRLDSCDACPPRFTWSIVLVTSRATRRAPRGLSGGLRGLRPARVRIMRVTIHDGTEGPARCLRQGRRRSAILTGSVRELVHANHAGSMSGLAVAKE